MKRVFLLQALASALILAPLFFLKYLVFVAHTDAVFYNTILRSVAHHLAAGDFPIRWAAELNGGAGSPVMVFYPPLAYIITAIIGAPLALMDNYGDMRVLFSMWLAQVIGGVGAYLWLRLIVSEKSALYTSLLFTIFPYQWMYALHQVNLAMVWALAWIPLMMLSAHALTNGNKKATLWYAFFLGLLALTHPRTLIAFAWVPALYTLVMSNRRKEILLYLIGAHALAFGLSAFYTLPAFFNLDLVQYWQANVGRFYYAENFNHPDLRRNIHFLLIATFALGMYAQLPAFRQGTHGKMLWLYLGVFMISLLLCLRIAKPLWDMLPLLQLLQFPVARFYPTALVAVTIFAAFYFEYRPALMVHRWLYSPALLVASLVLSGALIMYYINRFYEKPSDLTWEYVEEVRGINPIFPPEYNTRWQPTSLLRTEMHDIQNAPFASIVEGRGELRLINQNPRQLQLAVDAKAPVTIRIRQLYLPQWQASVGKLSADTKGFLQLQVPLGASQVMLSLSSFKGEELGNWFSLFAWSVFVVGLFHTRQRRYL